MISPLGRLKVALRAALRRRYSYAALRVLRRGASRALEDDLFRSIGAKPYVAQRDDVAAFYRHALQRLRKTLARDRLHRRARAPMTAEREPSGNRCGHDSRRPTLALAVDVPKNLPPIIYELVEKVIELVYWQRWKFSALGYTKRSERMEGIVRVLIALVVHTDLVSLRVGRPPTEWDPWFRGHTAKQIARWTGLRLHRCIRALDDLRWAGYITSVQPRELKKDGTYRGLAAVRNLTMKFFTHLGMKNKVDDARVAACKRLRLTHADERRERMLARRARRRATKTVVGLAKSATPTPETTGNAARYQAAHALREQHPDWSLRELLDAADRLTRR